MRDVIVDDLELLLKPGTKGGGVALGDLKATLTSLGALIEETHSPPEVSGYSALIPKTRFHVRISQSLLALAGIAWSVVRLATHTADPGDAVTVSSALVALHGAVTTLDVAAGERCAYLGVARASDGGPAEIKRALLSPDGDHCGSACSLHTAKEFDDVALELVLRQLKDRGVVREAKPGAWRVVL